MAINTVRRLAADVLNVGMNKIRIKPEGLKDAEGALTRADVRGLIEKGIIIKLRPQGRASTAKTGRRGEGHRRGTVIPTKTAWMEKVRAQRKFLAMLVGSRALDRKHKRALYMKIKSGIFRNKRAMLLYLKEAGHVAKDYEVPKAAPPVRKAQPQKQAPAQKKAGQKAPPPAQPKTAEAPKAAPAHAHQAGAAHPHAGHAHEAHKKGESK